MVKNGRVLSERTCQGIKRKRVEPSSGSSLFIPGPKQGLLSRIGYLLNVILLQKPHKVFSQSEEGTSLGVVQLSTKNKVNRAAFKVASEQMDYDISRKFEILEIKQ